MASFAYKISLNLANFTNKIEKFRKYCKNMSGGRNSKSFYSVLLCSLILFAVWRKAKLYMMWYMKSWMKDQILLILFITQGYEEVKYKAIKMWGSMSYNM